LPPLVAGFPAHQVSSNEVFVLALGATERVLSLESGFLHTVVSLTVAPGRMVREYLAGRQAPFTHPVGYLIISFAAFGIVFMMAGGTGADNRVFTALAVPCIAGASWLVFRRARLNFAEHLILVMYLVGHIVLFLAVVLVVGSAATVATTPIAAAALGVSVGYFAWAYSRIFDRRPVLAALGGLVVLLGGVAIWLGALFGLLNALRAAGGT
jgi:hypothetical protein